MALLVGNKAPDFSLPRQDGSPFRLSELLQRGPAVVYFYPRDETPGCTVEACAFRDAYEDFRSAGAEVVGISADSTEAHASFASHRKLPFIPIVFLVTVIAGVALYVRRPVAGERRVIEDDDATIEEIGG